MQIISERLKLLRAKHIISQKRLAEALDIKQNTLSQYETGVRLPSYEILIAIANYFCVTTDYLLGREG